MKRLVAGLLLAMLMGGLVAAQPAAKPAVRDPSYRSLAGQVLMPDRAPASGAVVKLKNLKTLQILSYITQADGRYRFNNLNMATDYEVRAEAPGMVSKKRSLSVFDQRAEAVADLKLAPERKPKSDSPKPRP